MSKRHPTTQEILDERDPAKREAMIRKRLVEVRSAGPILIAPDVWRYRQDESTCPLCEGTGRLPPREP